MQPVSSGANVRCVAPMMSVTPEAISRSKKDMIASSTYRLNGGNRFGSGGSGGCNGGGSGGSSS
jgi:hypothetical protein